MRDWLIVAGGIRRAGGQDRANLELVRYLAHNGRFVRVVANRVDSEVYEFPNTEVRLAHVPLGSNLLGEVLLRTTAVRVRRELSQKAYLLGNGGNVTWATINWVHCVHAAWGVKTFGAPAWRSLLARAKKRAVRRRERTALANARLVLANSRKTAAELTSLLGVPAERISVVYFGADSATFERVREPRFRIGFMGALGWDSNKGLDTALEAFALALAGLDKRYRLVVAGHGHTKPWREEARRLGIESRVDFLGFAADPRQFLSTVDVLISPVRYEAYGLAVHEALVEGVPVLVSADAGVAELMSSVPNFCITDKENSEVWCERLLDLTRNLDSARAEAARLAEVLTRRSWAQMAAELVSMVEMRV